MNPRKRGQSNILARLGTRPRIAILKPGGLGDFLAVTPALRALRKAIPEAHITLIGRPDLISFYQRYPQLDLVVACPPYTGMTTDGPSDQHQLWKFFSSFQADCLDLALQWAGNGLISNGFVKHLGARFTAGFCAPGAEELDLSLPFDDQRHEVLRYLDCLRALGIDADGIDMEAPLLPDDFAQLRRALPQLLDSHGRHFGVNPTSGDPKRRWPPERFARVADSILESCGFDSVILIGAPDQRDQVRAVAGHMRLADRMIDLSGSLELGGLAALLSQLDLLITNDSGPAHLAAAIGTPSVIIFGAGPPVKWSPTSWVWHRPVADWHSPCRQFVPRCCEGLPVSHCLDRITVEQVLSEAKHLIRLSEVLTPPNVDAGTQLAGQKRVLLTRKKSGRPRG